MIVCDIVWTCSLLHKIALLFLMWWYSMVIIHLFRQLGSNAQMPSTSIRRTLFLMKLMVINHWYFFTDCTYWCKWNISNIFDISSRSSQSSTDLYLHLLTYMVISKLEQKDRSHVNIFKDNLMTRCFYDAV